MKGALDRLGVNPLLLKITSLNGVSVILQILGGLITSKLVAIYLGERGMALLGYMRNFFTSTTAAGSLGFGSGVVARVAKSKKEGESVGGVIATAAILSIGVTFVISGVLFFGAAHWNDIVFKGEGDFIKVFRYLAFALPLITVNGLMVSYINGLSKYKKIVWINIIANLIGLGITISLIINIGIEGALLALVISPAAALAVTLFFLFKNNKELVRLQLQKVNFKDARLLGSYTIMAFFSAIILPLIYIAIRQYIVTQEGISYAGYWDAMTRISEYYLKFVATLMTLYILPQLAKATTNRAFRKEIADFYKTILPLFGIGVLCIYFLRKPIILLLFTEDFLVMESIFKWQLLGDFFKVASIVIGYQIIAKNMLKLFLLTEVLSLVVIYTASVYFIELYGFEGAAMGHCVAYFVHLCMLLFIFRKALFGPLNSTYE